jgi:hypothetical protein
MKNRTCGSFQVRNNENLRQHLAFSHVHSHTWQFMDYFVLPQLQLLSSVHSACLQETFLLVYGTYRSAIIELVNVRKNFTF